jgi:hypothetical protein
MFYLVYVVIETTFSTTYRKEEVNVKSYVKMVIIYRWYVFESFRCLKSPYHAFYIYLCPDYNAHNRWASLR